MEKLVICSRLHRPKTTTGRVSENFEIGNSIHSYTNPLFKFIIATELSEKVKFQDIFDRFVRINQKLKRTEIVNALCILKEATIYWSYFSKEDNEYKTAYFNREDLKSNIIPSAKFVFNKTESALYWLVTILMTSLFNSILAAEDIGIVYSTKDDLFRAPKRDGYEIPPDTE